MHNEMKSYRIRCLVVKLDRIIRKVTCCIAGLMLGWACLNFSHDYIARTITFNLSVAALLWLFISRPAQDCIETKDGVTIRRVK